MQLQNTSFGCSKPSDCRGDADEDEEKERSEGVKERKKWGGEQRGEEEELLLCVYVSYFVISGPISFDEIFSAWIEQKGPTQFCCKLELQPLVD